MLHTQASALVPTFQDEEIIKPAFVFLPLILHQLRVCLLPLISQWKLCSVYRYVLVTMSKQTSISLALYLFWLNFQDWIQKISTHWFKALLFYHLLWNFYSTVFSHNACWKRQQLVFGGGTYLETKINAFNIQK